MAAAPAAAAVSQAATANRVPLSARRSAIPDLPIAKLWLSEWRQARTILSSSLERMRGTDGTTPFDAHDFFFMTILACTAWRIYLNAAGALGKSHFWHGSASRWMGLCVSRRPCRHTHTHTHICRPMPRAGHGLQPAGSLAPSLPTPGAMRSVYAIARPEARARFTFGFSIALRVTKPSAKPATAATADTAAAGMSPRAHQRTLSSRLAVGANADPAKPTGTLLRVQQLCLRQIAAFAMRRDASRLVGRRRLARRRLPNGTARQLEHSSGLRAGRVWGVRAARGCPLRTAPAPTPTISAAVPPRERARRTPATRPHQFTNTEDPTPVRTPAVN
eukprot:359938-Chlamydomonas_euryale.AAC.8